ncbi:uncharacterized protein LOC113358418 [Papaver somniferum]|uniref:uncharacterized protein LOC113279578 n=3 Tax=Papaver somniferum TaxID=3469 RepID=UPI000E6F5846|nr:uncharacterized protein LOC113279578 [Papaver somniferum]XP_026449130.1 uncharacterized protein LOC113349371 [Papaver somniferum]XP_026457768.1 uncharacterized protein LOC113358418 [Papaver somniferum]
MDLLVSLRFRMDKSWMSTDRTKKRYREGVAAFLRYAVNHLKEEGETYDEFLMLCPCTNCLNLCACSVGDVEDHLFVNGIDQTYTIWNKHGEKDEAITSSKPVNVNNGMHAEFEMGTPTDAPDEDFGMGTPTDAPDTIDMMQAAEEFADDPIKFKKLLENAEKPLYEGCPNFTKLSAIVQLFKLKSKHGASDMFFNELLPLLKDMLPKEGNLMARSTYQAKKILKSMGSGYTKIHACINNCILYWNEYKDEKVCPTCKAPRWKVDRDGKVYENVPAKVLWYFDIIPRFQRLFQSKHTAKDLIWHDTTRNKDGVLRHPADSHAWREIDNNFPEIKGDPRNLRLAVSADGVDVNTGTKHHSGKRTWDAYAQEMFTLRAVVLWTINDYPALGTLCGCRYAGYHGCVVCRKKTHSIRLHDSNKNVYVGYRRFLPYEHPFRRQKGAFGGKQEWETAPEPMTGEEIYEENVGQSLVGTLLHNGNTKDGLNARKDLVRLGLKSELHPKTDDKGTILPAACYTLTTEEKDIFLETLSELRVPEGSISAKEIMVEELDKLQEDLCVTLCLLEKEVKLCGPVCFRWMYPFERCMKVIKGHVRNKNQPCGCIAEENVAEETIEIYCEYHKSIRTIGIPLDRHNTSQEGEPLSAEEPCIVTPEQLRQAHFYVMQNTPEIEPYIDRHKLYLETNYSTKKRAWLEKEHSNTFGAWLKNEVEKELADDRESISENLRWISHGPHYEVTKYTVYRINGYLFRTRSRDGRIHQNSGVSVAANDMHISRDDDVTYGKASYYGVLQEIWELDYCERKVHLFKCNWVDNKRGVKRDALGYKIVDLTMLGYKNDPFILASQAKQVFYVKDQLDKKKSIVFVTPPKNYRDDDGNDEEFSTVIFSANDNILPSVDPQDLGKESRNDYFRTDCRGLLIRKPK